MHNKEKQLETLVVANLVFLVCYFIFDKKMILKSEIIFTLTCLLIPAFLRFFHKAWSLFFSFLGEINSRILLAIVFFIFLTPIALLRKLLTKSAAKNIANNFVERNHSFIPKDFESMG